MLALDDPANPFRDWSFLYIPSCTGDVHTGDARVDYGSVVVEQRGWQNAHAALEHAFGEFDPDAVLVTGCSAGSVGSAWHAEDVIRAWPDARVTQVGDSLAYLFHRPIRLTEWGTNKHFPSFFQVGGARWTMEQFVTRLTRAYPDVTFARFNHANDNVQEAFYQAVGGDPVDFGPRLRAVEARLKQLPNYRSYLACGSRPLRVPDARVHVAARRGRAAQRLGARPRRRPRRRLPDLQRLNGEGAVAGPLGELSSSVVLVVVALEMPFSTARSASTMPWP